MTNPMTRAFVPADSERFEAALRRFDDANSRDPNQVVIDGRPQPYELVYARWLSDWVVRLCPEASEELRLAARCQHLCRWMIPRSSYPMTRAGYLQWRGELKKFHAEKSGQVLREVGYGDKVIRRIQILNLKSAFPHDAEARVLEDALCLVFLEHQLEDLAHRTSAEKLVGALRKSWNKMTPRAQAIGRALSLHPKPAELLKRALEDTADT